MQSRDSTVTVPALQQMKRAGQKIVGVVAWDFQIAQIVDRAGVDIVSVGDAVRTNLWGHASPLAVTSVVPRYSITFPVVYDRPNLRTVSSRPVHSALQVPRAAPGLSPPRVTRAG